MAAANSLKVNVCAAMLAVGPSFGAVSSLCSEPPRDFDLSTPKRGKVSTFRYKAMRSKQLMK